MTNTQLLLMAFLVTASFGLGVLFSAWIFRNIVKYNSFNGVDTDSADKFIEEQSFWKRISMTYIFKCNKTGKQRIAVAIWILVWHYIQVLFFLIFMIITWYDVIMYILLSQGVGEGASAFTYGYLLDFTMSVILLTLPIGLVGVIPFMILSKKKIEERSEPLATAKWERFFKRILEIAFPKK
ncbi:MAG: hypothetical protein FWC20_12440 [Oscillospiraceae bacterium]|nr:hypothetical protein [Oscillospiraceae bacterium]MCL2280194.1 hypothetical protein [Oscillospiraceae bacterium]